MRKTHRVTTNATPHGVFRCFQWRTPRFDAVISFKVFTYSHGKKLAHSHLAAPGNYDGGELPF